MTDKIQEELEKEIADKFILDACCGGRCFWFNKNHPNAIYQDIRIAKKGHIPARPNHSVEPDVVGDFTDMKHFKDNSFKLVVFDPPHLTQGGETGWQVSKYGKLPKDWPELITKGFNECWRVLDNYGTLVFKWNEYSVSFKDVLKCIPVQPLFGHPTAKSGKTKWFVFMKIPLEGKLSQHLVTKQAMIKEVEKILKKWVQDVNDTAIILELKQKLGELK